MKDTAKDAGQGAGQDTGQDTGVTGKGSAPLGVAVVGAGYWGPNLVRNFQSSDRFRLRWL